MSAENHGLSTQLDDKQDTVEQELKSPQESEEGNQFKSKCQTNDIEENQDVKDGSSSSASSMDSEDRRKLIDDSDDDDDSEEDAKSTEYPSHKPEKDSVQATNEDVSSEEEEEKQKAGKQIDIQNEASPVPSFQNIVVDDLKSSQFSAVQAHDNISSHSSNRGEIDACQLAADMENVKNQKRLSDDFSGVQEKEEDDGSEGLLVPNSEANMAKSAKPIETYRKESKAVDDKDSSSEEEEKKNEKKEKTKNEDASDSDDEEVDLDDDDEDEDDDGDADDDESLSEGAKQRLLEEEMKNEDEHDDSDDEDQESDEDQDSDEDGCGSNKDTDSLIEEDIANRSLNAEDEDQLVVIDNLNYLKYVSDRFNQQTDILEIVDRNERSFKQLAEKMIFQTSYLVQQPNASDNLEEGHGGPTAKRLMHFKHLPSITDTFHSTQSKNGFPYAISAVEQYVGIGSSDGGVRVFDQHERELRNLCDKSVKGVPVISLDMIRMRETSIFIIVGHQKGQLALYEIKGLRAQNHLDQSEDGIPIQPAQIQLNSKHLKTVNDIHEGPVIAVKFFGDVGFVQKKISVISSDLEGIVYLSYYQEGIISYQCIKQCFMKRRVGPTFSIAPLLVNCWKSHRLYHNDEELQAQGSYQSLSAATEDIMPHSNQIQLIAFGSLSRILIAQITPSAKELLFIDKPDYIDMGTVPYLDWGYGLSPCCRDKSYPMLAIAWGRILQLALYTNFQSKNIPSQGKSPYEAETPMFQYDGFYICDSTIDQCFFLTESILFIIVNKKEVRILYTQNFTPGLFDETYQLNDLTGKQNFAVSATKLATSNDRKQYFLTLKEKFVGQVSTYAEKDKGYRLLQGDEIKFKDNPYTGNNVQQRSNYNYNPTICKNKENTIVALGKSSMGQGQLLHWEEYLDLIRKTNQDNDCWLKVLRAALDIYNGKLIGLAGIPDHKETREQMLRDEMKEQLRQNIDSCIKEFQEGACVSTKTIRVALEFCIRVNALDHLFGELFQMFAEAGMEQRFFENLEPFILSGKFKQTKIPKKILVRLIEYYRCKDKELLEKVLLNLNLSKYKNILEVRHICETEFLTSALIHILTNLFDNDNENTVCLQLLCSLYNMMMKSQYVKEKQDIFKLMYYDYQYQPPGTEQLPQMIQSQNSSDPNVMVLSKKEKLEIEQSQTYIGYKLMWVMKMFLEGKKFPQGSLSAFKWRIYVYDIVRFATNDKFLEWFLAFDPDCFFKLMKTLFLDQEPYEYIQSQKGFIEMYRDSVQGLDACMTHTEIVDALQQQVISYLAKDRDNNNGFLSQKGECALNAFIFFVAQISRKPQVPVPSQLGVFVVREHLKFYRKLMKIPDITSEAPLNKLSSIGAYQQNTASLINASKKTQKQAAKQDKLSRLYLALIKKNEKDVIILLQRIEEEIEMEEIVALLHDAEKSPMFKVRVYLLQLQNNHKECLEMYFKVPAIREDVFTWLNDLEAKQQQLINEQNSAGRSKDSINRLILNYIPKLVDMNASQAIKLVEQWLMSEDCSNQIDHLQVVDERLKGDLDLSLKYLSTLLTEKENLIQEEHSQLLIGNSFTPNSKSQLSYFKYKELMLRYVNVLLQVIGEKRLFRGHLAEFVKKKYVPIEESYQLILEAKNSIQHQGSLNSPKKKSLSLNKAQREREINEALGILCKRQGDCEKAIDLYIQVLIQLSQDEVMSALYISNGEVPFENQAACNGNKDIMKFDSLIQDIVKICDKVGGNESEQEALWLHAIRSLYKVKQILFEDSGNRAGEKKEKKDHKRFATFHMIRVQYFMRRMAEHVSLPKIIQFLEDINASGANAIKYQECRATFEDKMRTEQHHENILINAATLLLKDLNADFAILKHLHQRGIVNDKEKCDHCKRNLISRWDPQSVCVFNCHHVFHQRCAQNNGFKCSICLNEYEEIQQIINQRGVRRVAQGKSKKAEGQPDLDDVESSASTASGNRLSSKLGNINESASIPRERSSSQVDAAPPRKVVDIEREQKSSLIDTFNMQMLRFEAELNDKIAKIDQF